MALPNRPGHVCKRGWADDCCAQHLHDRFYTVARWLTTRSSSFCKHFGSCFSTSLPCALKQALLDMAPPGRVGRPTAMAASILTGVTICVNCHTTCNEYHRHTASQSLAAKAPAHDKCTRHTVEVHSYIELQCVSHIQHTKQPPDYSKHMA